MSKHTPGPWSLFDALTITAPQRGSVAFAYGPSMPEQSANGRESMANARLIAAAPELLRELQEARIALCLMLSYHGQGSADYADAAQVRAQVAIDGSGAAIAKATGEQQ